MHISESQITDFNNSELEQTLTELQEKILEDFPWAHEAYSPLQLRIEIQYAIMRAVIANELVDPYDIEAYVDLMFRISPDFDQTPELHKLIFNKTLTPHERWDSLIVDPQYKPILERLADIDNMTTSRPEKYGNIAKAYPLTYNLPGFQKLYAHLRKTAYHFLDDGEDL